MKYPLESKFGRALVFFTANLSPEEAEDFRFVTLNDLKQAVLDIQAEQESGRRLQNLRRLDSFLEAMEQYDKVVQIFLNAADLLAFIWTASTWAESFNALLDAYEEIGDHIPLLKQYEQLIKQSPQLQTILGMIYKDILYFHQKAIKHSRNRVWKQLFHATWKTFRTDFHAVLRNLQCHKDLLDSQATLIAIQQSQRITAEIKAERRQRHEDEEKRRKREVYSWLASADSAGDQEIATDTRSRYPTTGRWIFQESLVKSWYDPDAQSEPCLWINGKPGAGKSTLASLLIQECGSISRSTVAYFYCRAEDCNRNTFIGVSRSIILQLSLQNPSVMAYTYETASLSGRSQLDSTSLAKEMLDVVLNTFDSLFLVIDGIDECKKAEKERISSTFISIAGNHTSFLRCCFISQDDKDTGKLFRSLPTFRITARHNQGDIASYCAAMESDIANSFQICADDIRNLDISHNVATKADGMFLFAKLVMENLLQQCTRADLEAEIERIPPDLDKAYDRLLVRILKDAPLPEQRVAKKLLCWLLCTRRPLKWHEIQGAMSFDPENSTFDYRGRSFKKDSKQFCGSLVGNPKGWHRRTCAPNCKKFFLEKQEELQLDPEEVHFTCICLSYLTLSSHDDGISDDSVHKYVQEGHYALSDYAVVYWQEHINITIRGKALENQKSLRALTNTIRLFLSRRFTTSTGTGHQSSRLIQHLRVFEREDFYAPLIQAMVSFNNDRGGLAKPNSDPGPIISQLLHVRGHMERTALEGNSTEKTILQSLYGENVFKCPDVRCNFFHEGFPTVKQRDTHRNKHIRGFFCSYPGCPSAVVGFTTSAELKRHNVDYHMAVIGDGSFPWNEDIAPLDIAKEIRKGNLPAVEAWADQWEDRVPVDSLWFPSAARKRNTSPLGLAIRYGKREIFDTLLERAPELSYPIEAAIVPSETEQVFAQVMRSGNEDMILSYIRRLIKVDPVLFATAVELDDKDVSTVIPFLEKAASGADLAFKANAASYLRTALTYGHEGAAQYLLFDKELISELHCEIENSMAAASREMWVDFGRLLLQYVKENIWNPEISKESVMCASLFAGKQEFLREIIPANEADFWIDGARLLGYCGQNDASMVAMLLQNEHICIMMRDEFGRTALEIAILQGYSEVVTLLAEDPRMILDDHISAQDTSALHTTLMTGSPQKLEILLNAALPVEEVSRTVVIDLFRGTALEFAKEKADSCWHRLHEYFVANTDWSLYPMDSSALMRFCDTGNLLMVKNALRRAPQDLDAPDSKGVAPFLQAVKSGRHEIVEFLLASGCGVSALEGRDRFSPLMFAVMDSDLSMVRLLFSKVRVDPTYRNGQGKTALDYLNPSSPVAENIRDEIRDATDMASVFQGVDEQE